MGDRGSHNRKIRGIKGSLWDFKNDTFLSETETKDLIRRYLSMKGYVTASGYMGYVENEYILFASEDDYFDYMEAI